MSQLLNRHMQGERAGLQPQPRSVAFVRTHALHTVPFLPQNASRTRRDVHVDVLKGFGKVDSKQKTQCPCGSGVKYSDCCQKLHKVQQMKVSGPEQLLRARFSAYIKKDWKYVIRTTHTNNSARQGSTSADGKIKTSFEQDVKVTMSWAEMSNLEVLQVRQSPSADKAEIDFRYSMKQMFELSTGERIKDPPTKVITETAVFEVEEGDWKLVSSQSNWDRNTLQAVS